MVKFLIPSVVMLLVLLPMMARFTSLVQYFLFISILDRICYSSSLVFWCICNLVLLFSQPLKSLIHSCERLSCVSQTAARIPIIFIENSDRYTVKYTAKELMTIVNSEDGKHLEHSDINPLRKKTPQHRVGVVCLLQFFFSLTFSIVYCTMSLLAGMPQEYFYFPNMLPKVSSYGQFDNCGEGPSDNSHKKYFCPSSLNIS